MTAWLTFHLWRLLSALARWRLDSRLGEIRELEQHGITCGEFVCQLRAEARTLTSHWIECEVKRAMAAARLHMARRAR